MTGELFNESILMLTLYCVLTFTPWLSDPLLKFDIGYVCIVIVASHLIVNLSLIFRTSIVEARNKWKLRRAKKKYRVWRNKRLSMLKTTHG